MDKKSKNNSEENLNRLMFVLSLFAWIFIVMIVSGMAGVGLFFLSGNLVKAMMFSSLVTFIFLVLGGGPNLIRKNEKKTTRSNNRRRR